ncbi:MAG: tetratricopeptide repeat protein [Bacteroidales bacterium]|nr:tetratricopeptide repeat protein [Bacteroidales bacterium]
MKKILVILVSCIFSTIANAEPDSRMQQALANCQEGKYEDAINAYEAILSEGRESATLYYNLGYAYYKSGSLGKAIVNMERAKRLAPGDADVVANLEQAYSMTDQMQTLEPVFFVSWWRSFTNILGSDGWAVVFVVVFILFLLGVSGFLFADAIVLRKVGFYSAIVLFFVGVVALSISIGKRNAIIDGQEGIIMSSSVTLTTSPDKNGSEMAVLHEGTHVEIVSELGEWIEVQLKDGNIGWLKKADIEVI